MSARNSTAAKVYSGALKFSPQLQRFLMRRRSNPINSTTGDDRSPAQLETFDVRFFSYQRPL
jgi:hypothetical protein